MVKVWYQPPPYGVGTDLNRSGYGVPKGTSRLLEKLAKTNPLIVYPTGVLFFTILACIPGWNDPMPFTMEPEYQAAQRAYMRYHNMNPIFGISSKKARAMDKED